ncbi:interferon lambda-3-like [Porphyrio hochstetteri]
MEPLAGLPHVTQVGLPALSKCEWLQLAVLCESNLVPRDNEHLMSVAAPTICRAVDFPADLKAQSHRAGGIKTREMEQQGSHTRPKQLPEISYQPRSPIATRATHSNTVRHLRIRGSALAIKMLHLSFALLLSVVLGYGLGAAFPRDTLKKNFSLSKYQFLVPHELKAVQKMKEQFENIMLLSDRKCHTRLFHRKWRPADLSVADRVMLVEAELELATAMLGLPTTTPAFAEARQRPLAFLTQVWEDLRGWMATEAPSHQPSGKLRHWLQKLQTAKETETTGCLEASTILHLFQVLNDLRCAALQKQCT